MLQVLATRVEWLKGLRARRSRPLLANISFVVRRTQFRVARRSLMSLLLAQKKTNTFNPLQML